MRAIHGPKISTPPFAAIREIVGTPGIPCVSFDIVQAAKQLLAKIEEIFSGFADSAAEMSVIRRIEESVAEGVVGRVSSKGTFGIGFAVMEKEAAKLAALPAHDEAVVQQIELVAVEFRRVDFAPHIDLQAKRSGNWGGCGHLVSGRAFGSLFVVFVNHGVQGAAGGIQMVFAAFSFVGGSGGLSELLKVKHAAELVEAADSGAALVVMQFGQAGMRQGFEAG